MTSAVTLERVQALVAQIAGPDRIPAGRGPGHAAQRRRLLARLGELARGDHRVRGGVRRGPRAGDRLHRPGARHHAGAVHADPGEASVLTTARPTSSMRSLTDLRRAWGARPGSYSPVVWALILALDGLPWPWGEEILARCFVARAFVRRSRFRQALAWARAQPDSSRAPRRLARALCAYHGRFVARSALVGMRDPDTRAPSRRGARRGASRRGRDRRHPPGISPRARAVLPGPARARPSPDLGRWARRLSRVGAGDPGALPARSRRPAPP